MKRILPLLLSALLVASCAGGDGFTPSAQLLATAQCAGLNLENFAGVYNVLNTLMGGIPASFPIGTGITYQYTIGTGAFTITGPFGTIAGVVTPVTGVITDGLDVGEAASATWSMNGGLAGSPTLTGEGNVSVSRTTATEFAVTGNGGLADGTCQLDYSAFTLADDSALPLVAPVGTITFTATAPEGMLAGVITLNGSNAAFVEATFDGEDVVFVINLTTFEVTF